LDGKGERGNLVPTSFVQDWVESWRMRREGATSGSLDYIDDQVQ